ncbi:hypothetical protein K443DRAFT_212931, partial [Laccaria amethystina LaAM-08-1]
KDKLLLRESPSCWCGGWISVRRKQKKTGKKLTTCRMIKLSLNPCVRHATTQ